MVGKRELFQDFVRDSKHLKNHHFMSQRWGARLLKRPFVMPLPKLNPREPEIRDPAREECIQGEKTVAITGHYRRDIAYLAAWGWSSST